MANSKVKSKEKYILWRMTAEELRSVSRELKGFWNNQEELGRKFLDSLPDVLNRSLEEKKFMQKLSGMYEDLLFKKRRLSELYQTQKFDFDNSFKTEKERTEFHHNAVGFDIQNKNQDAWIIEEEDIS
jgi:hypothetical protein